MKKYYFLFLGSFVLLLFFNNFMQLAFLPMKSAAVTPDTVDIATIIRYCPTIDDFRVACDGPAATMSGCASRMAQCPACTTAYPDQKTYCEGRMGGGACMSAYTAVTLPANGCLEYPTLPASDPRKATCRDKLQACVSSCNDPFKKACNELMGGGSGQCQAAVDAITAMTTVPTEAEKADCRTKCAGADPALAEGCERLDVGRSSDGGTLRDAEVVTPPGDVGGGGDDGGYAGDNDSGNGDIGGSSAGGDMSGMVNSNLQQQFLSGLGGMDLPDFNTGDQNPVDFTKGRGADGDYQGAASKVSSANIGNGYRSNGINTNMNQPWDKPMMGHNKPFKAEVTPANAGRGGGGGMGGGGSVGGGGPQGRPNQARRGGPLNDLSSIKNMGLNYHPPGGSQAGGARRGPVAANQRLPARYKAKVNGEQAALNRLFGARPAALPGADINGCKDTVFCHMERHFQNQLIRATASEPSGR